MKAYTKIGLFSLMFALIFISCKKDENNDPAPSGGTGGSSSLQADFTASADTVFQGSYVSFINNSQGATNYFWEIGDSTFTSANPEYQFWDAGTTYQVRLVATSGSGATSEITKPITVLSAPTKVKITKLVVDQFPFTNGSGNNWDPTSEGNAPDIYFQIKYNGSIIYDHGSANRVEDVPQLGTCSWDNLSLTLNSSTDYIFYLYDYDPSDSDDEIGYVSASNSGYDGLLYSTPIDYVYTGIKYYPSEVTLSNATTTIKLTVEWLP